jgi:hypothetical protein
VAVPERPAIHRMQATVMMLAEHAVHVAAPAREACPGGCAHLSDTLPASGHPGSWSVCLAILAAFAVAMLVGWLMRAATVHGRRQCPRCGLRVGRVLSTPAHRCVERSSYS